MRHIFYFFVLNFYATNQIKVENLLTNNFFKNHSIIFDKFISEFNKFKYLKKYDFEKKFGRSVYRFKFKQNGKKIALESKTDNKIIFDIEADSKGKKYYNFLDYAINDSNTYLAYSVDDNGSQVYKIFLYDLKRNKIKKVFYSTSGEFAWLNDSTIVYVKTNKTRRNYQVNSYDVKSKLSKVIFEEYDVTCDLFLYKSSSKEYIFILSYCTCFTKYHYLKCNVDCIELKSFPSFKDNIIFYPLDGVDKFYFLTNYNSKEFKVMTTSVNELDIKNWKDFYIPPIDTIIENFIVFKDFLVLHGVSNLQNKLIVISLKTRHIYEFSLGIGELDFSSVQDFYNNIINFSMESLNYSNIFYLLDLKNLKKRVQFKDEVNKKLYSYLVKSDKVLSRDKKTYIPITIFYKNKLKNYSPVLLKAYAAYGKSYKLNFDYRLLSLLDEGFIFVVAHARGGGEKGQTWYKDGKLLNKKNTFYDCLDAADYLLKKNITTSRKLFFSGLSAGGLICGYIANNHSNLFKGIIAEYPFLNPLESMFDSNLPLTTLEYFEWGNPKKSLVEKDYIASYCPHNNVKKQCYTNFYAISSELDSVVSYKEAFDFVLKLKKNNRCDSKILLDVSDNSAHGGSSESDIKNIEDAKKYTFMKSLI